MQATGYDFDDPVDLLLFLDDDLLKGAAHGGYDLHPWQRQVLKDFAVPTTADNPYQAVVRAANGSGKDKFIIAACVVWLCMKYPMAVAVVTSASGTQLDRQTNSYIELLCRSANKKFGFQMWKLNYRHYECRFPDAEGNFIVGRDGEEVRSTIDLFVTDEPGRAEGWHPLTHDSQMAIFTSEAKSVPDFIFHSFARCTGFTKRVDVSSPGIPMGHFFDRCTTAARTWRQGEGWTTTATSGWTQYHITAYDCPHLSKSYIEQCRNDYGGEGSALFKSMVLAEFGTTDEATVIPYHLVWNGIHNTKIPWTGEPHNIAGLDLAAGGDENALVVRNGNKVVNVIGFRMEDTAKTVDHLERLFKDNKLNHPDALIYGDAGGLGKPILDQLKRRGWHNIRYVLNQREPYDKRAYYNRGAEMWFGFRKLLENGEIILADDERSKRQLSTRFYKQTEGARLQLESKLVARSKGHPSPDRADATVLAFTNYKSRFNDGVEVERLPIPPRPTPPEAVTPVFTIKEYAKRQSAPDEYAKYYGNDTGHDGRPNIEHLQQLVSEYNQRLREKQNV